MSTGYGWEGLRQVCAMPLGARHVLERLCGGLVYLGHYNKCSPLPFLPSVVLEVAVCCSGHVTACAVATSCCISDVC